MGHQGAFLMSDSDEIPPIEDMVDLPLRCEKCGQEFEESLSRLKRDGQFTCPACGTVAVVTFNE
jgi:DNA-directed RNA polymerase subunit RPC12/RpoP